MHLTPFARETLRVRRGRRDLQKAGFEEVGDNGGKLWELHRGGRLRHIITDVRICPSGKSIWIKTAEKGKE